MLRLGGGWTPCLADSYQMATPSQPSRSAWGPGRSTAPHPPAGTASAVQQLCMNAASGVCLALRKVISVTLSNINKQCSWDWVWHSRVRVLGTPGAWVLWGGRGGSLEEHDPHRQG